MSDSPLRNGSSLLLRNWSIPKWERNTRASLTEPSHCCTRSSEPETSSSPTKNGNSWRMLLSLSATNRAQVFLEGLYEVPLFL
ncbi:hypothetical protein mru_0304 [Methanobrevibacter ruminantium M1]|uniref:Uncharacterized protein n=1 Tax=Methanobrevibacter ruminantium (strain ATCC 35063 / DSM 1093 / JCM 13430 / OCM 146 / M1) TaxID=634498 RepID=D3DZY0_METRM|nr:hypothetical protein mru_0304 [Methanobrevibacter ruminantium M1]